ncbi:MAG: tetratricopeptide repeat protein [Alistipes sp.]|nr:tetratricopeptide repeat protein [Alistipes sp.]MBQ2842723.1 tetratricopeptide repeat protein [Alistipes sp.]MBR4052651.1 tetratricopeptide repeat protein [Alistipes sp.]
MKKLFVLVAALFAVCSLSAQDLKTVFNEGGAAYTAKNFQLAAEKFEQVIAEGMDMPDMESTVASAKTYLPKCYYMLGGRAAQAKNLDVALENFTKAADKAELYGDATNADKYKVWVGRIYQMKGGEAFNSKDYATAVAVFEKGYAADQNNTAMALNLAMSYCELGEFEKGMDIYEVVAAKKHPKYAADAAKAKEQMALYTNNEVAKLQGAGDFDGIIAMADKQLAKNPVSPTFQLVRLQAYLGKKDYKKVIELGEEAAAAQTDEADKSMAYFQVGAAHNALSQRDQAIAAFQKVTAGPAAENAKAALAELNK